MPTSFQYAGSNKGLFPSRGNPPPLPTSLAGVPTTPLFRFPLSLALITTVMSSIIYPLVGGRGECNSA